ncbi:imidazole glycerol phosphate synthase subunit HisF [Parafilimonas sp.]|uniref:imidazole glycerol phosphate synthase subunit HisF n=1 Tax=Parafilimonas sp. TaxID=1969739 RepID=UPI003F8062FF
MPLTKRIIPCLDVKDGRTVKGVNFVNIRDAGDAVELASIYAEQGADELVFLDITATNEKRKTLLELVNKVASAINIPFTVGGGISSVEDVSVLLNAGADKVSINTAAIKRPALITEIANQFGTQCTVLAVDAKFENDNWYVYLNGGRVATTMNAIEWMKQAIDLGAGEILLTSINHDGTKQGFANELIKEVESFSSVPVIASGGAGNMQHFADVFEAGADAALAASLFHYKEISIPELKAFLKKEGVNVRIAS